VCGLAEAEHACRAHLPRDRQLRAARPAGVLGSCSAGVEVTAVAAVGCRVWLAVLARRHRALIHRALIVSRRDQAVAAISRVCPAGWAGMVQPLAVGEGRGR
jgi:hypothetical protein